MSILRRGKLRIEDNYMKRLERRKQRQEEGIAHQLEQGRKIQSLMLTNSEEDNMRAYRILNDEQQHYKSNAFKQWICLFFGISIGLLLGVPTQMIYSEFGFAWYNRSGLDKVAFQNLKTLKFDDVYSDELLVTSYEYNSKTPRFYSKYFKNKIWILQRISYFKR